VYPEKYFVYSEMTMMVVRRTSEVSENASEKVIPILARSDLQSTRCTGIWYYSSEVSGLHIEYRISLRS
jgi:hypothetical protein